MNDKKKLAVLIVLAVAVLGIGAFQFGNLSGSEPPKPVAKRQPQAAPVEEATPPQQEQTPPESPVADLYKLGMSARDPFQEGNLPLAEGMTPTPPAPSASPAVARAHRPRRATAWRGPSPLQGEGFAPLPTSGPSTAIQPGAPLRQPGDFEVAGVITGAKPAAVFVDPSGNQRLVTVGGALDGDSRLVSVEKGKVTVEHKGKTKTINVGGTPNVK